MIASRRNLVRSAQSTAAEAVNEAKKLARSVESWADFSNAMFDPEQGVVARLFPGSAERQAFFKTREFQAVSD